MTKKELRMQSIIEQLVKFKSLKTSSLANFFSVSEMTIRRDLKELKEKGLLLDVPGLAILNNDMNISMLEQYSVESAALVNIDEKKLVANKALNLLKENETIIIDNGSTLDIFANIIPEDIHLTVFTFNVNVLNHLIKRPKIDIIFGGGHYHHSTGICESPESINMIKNIRANKAFVSAAGIDLEMGTTTLNSYELPIKRSILNNASEKILISDNSKFGIVCPYHISEVSNYDCIVSSSELDADWLEYAKNNDIELI